MTMWDDLRIHAQRIGDEIHLARRDQGESLHGLATWLGEGLDAPLLSRIERGMQIPSVRQDVAISAWLLQCGRSLPEPVARQSDPDTSHAAAASVSDYTISHLRLWWLQHLAGYRGRDLEYIHYDSPLGYDVTDEGAYGLHQATHDELVSESGFRTRRSELVKMGYVQASEHRFPISTGRDAIAWEITDTGLQALMETP